MKKTLLLSVLIGFATILIVGCDDDVVSEKHVYSEEELAEKEKEEGNGVNADHIITLEITLPADESSYSGVSAEVDADEIAEIFGYSSAELMAEALGYVSSGAQYDHEISFFAINGSTGYDYLEAFTANGFGYWFDANGDVCSWGETAHLYSEFNEEAFTFYVGQYPGRLTVGETYTIIQLIADDDTRVAFVIDITVGEPYEEEIPEVENMANYELDISVTPDNSYAAVSLAFDFAEAAVALGVSEEELSENRVIYGISSDGSMTSSYTADAGYWFNKSGDVCQWGADECAVFVNYEDGFFHIGQFPDACEVGDSYTVKLAIMIHELKMVTYVITISIIDYQDPEDVPEGDPYEVAESYEFSQVYADDWSGNTRIDVKEVLRDAFKMTTYQIHQAISNGELVFSGINSDGTIYTDEDGSPVSTATYPGHWFSLEGDVTTFGSETNLAVVYSELAHTNESLQFSIGHHPGNAVEGNVIEFKQVAELNGGKAEFSFKITVQAEE